MARFLYFAVLIVPILEVAVFAAIAQMIGFWSALGAVVAISLVGAAIVQRQGPALLAEIQSTLAQGRMPARAMADVMLVGIAGVLMLVPGYLTDIVGLLLLVPPLRHFSYRVLARRFGARFSAPSEQEAPRPPPVIDLDHDQFRS